MFKAHATPYLRSLHHFPYQSKLYRCELATGTTHFMSVRAEYSFFHYSTGYPRHAGTTIEVE
ncbi:uncharacterized protein PHALS_15348 [Plasmopara halstedii]|uniref:Uncharacterized protein n=1 Tax=Plasmopara halstedii TaxID=4781 RepID=A0A0P1AV93_PLAHL|nr:uncharacterized protein PHALS_15348 [Plasmopara halstedii]CEG44589.1 hypothetical protein PHALS_15348 [Plasmopara halstedii]|eukprot:XP_024580958.1 hypothetical protein PHALS_15348 [Plasmopara halstedii]